MTDTVFKTPAQADLAGARDITEIAQREGFSSSTDWAARFAQALCNGESLDVMRERFTALVSVAGRISPDSATAEELGRHLLILDTLFKKLIIQSVEVASSGQRGSSEAAERLLNGAFKAQRAAMACLSSLKVLRDTAPAKPPTTASAPAPPSPWAGSPALSGPNELLLRHALD